MKKTLFIISILISTSIFGQQTPAETQVQSVNESEVNAKLKDLETQKANLETQIANLKNQLPKPLKPNWEYKGNLSANLGQVLLNNWAAGGFSNFNALVVGHAEANYEKNRHKWLNSLDANVGFVKNYDPAQDLSYPIMKNQDQFLLSSKYFYQISPTSKWSYAFIMNFGSQFYKTFDVLNPEILISDFMAPGFLNLSPGVNYKPFPYFTIFMTPVSGQFNFVLNDELVNKEGGSFGNQRGQKVRSEFGARVDAVFEKEVVKNLKVRSRLQLFNNWSRSDRDPAGNTRRWNVDINSQTDIFYMLTKNIALNFGLQMVYDDDVLILDPKSAKSRPILQIREAFGIGFTYGF